METQRCPLCGQPNPPQAEVCQYCQARLRPLWADSSSAPSSPPDNQVAKRSLPPESGEPLPPGRLSGMRSQIGTEESAQAEHPPQGVPPSKGTLESEDWLEGLFSGSSEGQAEDIPAWLRSLRGDSADKAERVEEPPMHPLFSASQPSVFSQAPQSKLELEGVSPPGEGEIGSGIAQEERPVPPFEGLDTFALEGHSFPGEDKLDTSTPLTAKEASPKSSPAAPSAEEDWMSEIPPWLETLPGQEWVEEESPEKAAPPELLHAAVPPFIETEEELSEVEFPSWLDEAERSIEPQLDTLIESLSPQTTEPSMGEKTPEGGLPQATAPFQEEALIEIAGPLHGLRGVLPAEPLVAAQTRPPRPIAELLVTEKQRAQAELFLKLIEAEGKPIPPPPLKRAKPHSFWRILIFLVLLTTAAVGLVIPPFAATPQELSVAVFDAMQAVGQLPGDATVLLVVDMEGGNFAEIQATTNALLDQMMIKGAFFVLVSTHQEGVLQADRLLREVSRLNGHRYQPSSGWVNLGYLPGGATGIQALSESLVELLPYTVEGKAAWQQDRLKNIRSISDFDLILVITEDSTRARQWVEQLNGKYTASKLLFAVSAQVEPVLRPYYEANPRQVQSMLAGIRDGAIYETQAARPGWATRFWSAYLIVVLTGIALITLGSLVYSISGLGLQKSSPREGNL